MNVLDIVYRRHTVCLAHTDEEFGLCLYLDFVQSHRIALTQSLLLTHTVIHIHNHFHSHRTTLTQSLSFTHLKNSESQSLSQRTTLKSNTMCLFHVQHYDECVDV